MSNELKNLFPIRSEIPENATIGSLDCGRDIMINGKIKPWDGPCREILSPVLMRQSGRLDPVRIAYGAMLTRREAINALEAAVSAYDGGAGPWPRMTVGRRVDAGRSFLSLMKRLRDRITRIEMWEIAKSSSDAQAEFDRTVAYLEGTMEQALRDDRESLHVQNLGSVQAIVRRAPLGVTLCMGPFNVPLFETLCTALPAALMGNTVLIKLPRLGGLAIQALLPAFAECFPPGVINVIDGDGQRIIPPIMEAGKLAALAFIGSSQVANIIRKAHPFPNRLRKVLGLDAKNPAIILKDADLELTVGQCVAGALGFNGQRCTGLKQIWVHRDVERDFLDLFCAAVDRLPLGMPWENPVITPLAEPDKPAWLSKLVQDALQHGAKVVNQGGEYCGTFFRPAVLHPVNGSMDIAHVEQFGPVVPVSTFDQSAQFLDAIRESNFGQQVSLFGQDPGEMGDLIDRLATQYSRINVNSYCRRGPDVLPFTGRKDSAESVLSISESLSTFSAKTVVAVQEAGKDVVEKIVRDGRSAFLKGASIDSRKKTS